MFRVNSMSYSNFPVKYYLRRHWTRFLDCELPEIELEMACYEAVTAEKARGWFSDCGYIDH
jgi:hypothetical protein